MATADTRTGVPLPLTTLIHQTPDELAVQVKKLCDDREIDQLIIGLPLLLTGKEGKQAALVRAVAGRLQEGTGLPIVFQDERYTSRSAVKAGARKPARGRGKRSPAPEEDAIAALHLLSAYLGV